MSTTYLIGFDFKKSNLRKSKFEQNNAKFIQWLKDSYFTFNEIKTVEHGQQYVITVDDQMKLWAENKLKELATVNNLHVTRCEVCTCICHEPGKNVMHFSECCHRGIVRNELF